jgi:hypothetical protein
MAHVHDKQRIKIGNKTWSMYMIKKNKDRKQNMAHVHDKQRIKMGNKTWPMYMINKE